MKIHVLSDTHLEFYANKKKEVEKFFVKLREHAEKDNPDIAIIAGDFCVVNAGYRDLFLYGIEQLCSIYKSVYYVPGNHEYWGGWIDTTDLFLASLPLTHPNLKVMLASNDAKYEQDGITVSGGTLWYHRDVGSDFVDFNRVYDGEESIFAAHDRFLQLPLHELDIVVSHHFPTEESISPEWVGYFSNDFFCARIEKHLQSFSKLPKLYVHGHTHGPHDYISKYGFRVYCNPRGYPKEDQNPDFWNRLLVEIDTETKS